jgi:hypothetical protein
VAFQCVASVALTFPPETRDHPRPADAVFWAGRLSPDKAEGTSLRDRHPHGAPRPQHGDGLLDRGDDGVAVAAASGSRRARPARRSSGPSPRAAQAGLLLAGRASVNVVLIS